MKPLTSLRAGKSGRLPSLVVRAGLLAMISTNTVAQQAEITPFKLTDVSGTIAARYLLDEQIRGESGSADVFQERPTTEEELYIETQSYIFHPDFLNMDIGAGALLVQQQFDSNAGDNSSSEALFNMMANLDFLSAKEYPVTLYFHRTHPSITTSLAGRFLVEQTKYGLNTSLREPLSPVLLSLEAFHIDTQGSGFDTSVDDVVDEGTFRAQKSYGDGNRISLTQRLSHRDSKSGSPDSPIQQSVSKTNSTDIDARNRFGNKKQFDLTQQLSLSKLETEQGFNTDVRDRRYFGNLMWSHSEQTRSFYKWQTQRNLRPGIDAVINRLQMGASHSNGANRSASGNIHFNTDENEGFDKEVIGGTGSFNYIQPFDFGSVQFGATLSYDRTDQDSTVDFVSVFDESLTLAGTISQDLRNDFVITGSVVVRNIAGTQVYTEGLDYRLIIVGDVTSVERLIGGNIIDGQTVLADYQYRSGGTMNFDTTSQSYSMTTKVLDYINLYLRFRETNHDLRSGLPTTPLNSVRNYKAGLRVDYPLSPSWTIGGEYSYTDQDEDIAPFVRNNFDAYAQVLLPWQSILRISGHKETVDNATSLEDVDLVEYRVGLTMRPWNRLTVAVDANYLDDTGGSLRRLRRSQNLALEWRYRQVRFVLRGQHLFESQGITDREQTIVKAELSRVF